MTSAVVFIGILGVGALFVGILLVHILAYRDCPHCHSRILKDADTCSQCHREVEPLLKGVH
jgi:hypothetical protein